MMCASVCVTRGKEGLSRREQLCQVLNNVPLLGVAYCLAEAFYKQVHCASPGRGGVWLMMRASVCVTEG